MFYESAKRDRTILPHDPFKALIMPRPIGWVSTKSAKGEINLAPYSFFNALSGSPPIIAFSSDGVKDSVTFVRETGEFVWNMATYDLRMEVNATSAPLPRGESEFAHAGLEMEPSRMVGPPRVKISPASLECKLIEIIQLKDMDQKPLDQWLVIGQAIGVHIDERFIKDGIVDVPAMQPIARCGYQDYAIADHMFQLRRPKGGGNEAAGG